MKKLYLLCLPIAVALWQAAPNDDRPAPERAAAIERDVRDFLGSYIETMEAGDPEAIQALFVADGRFAWDTDGKRVYASGDDVLAALRALGPMQFQTTNHDVDVLPLSPRTAHARSSFTTRASNGNVEAFRFSGVTTWLLEADDDGRWQVLKGHTSTARER